jgi:hypothetical protein
MDEVTQLFERWRDLIEIDPGEEWSPEDIDRVSEEIAELEQAIATTPARTIDGIVAKARVARWQAEHGAPGDDVDMPQSLLADLEHYAAAAARTAAA